MLMDLSYCEYWPLLVIDFFSLEQSFLATKCTELFTGTLKYSDIVTYILDFYKSDNCPSVVDFPLKDL